MLKLNDDCLLLICEYLDIYDHIRLSNTSSQWADAVKEYYRRAAVTTTKQLWQYYDNNEIEFEQFWQTISATLTKLIYEPKQEQHFNLLSLCELPNLKYFSCSLWELFEKLEANALKNFLQANCNQLEHLKLKHIRWRDFEALQKLKFSKLNDLELMTKFEIVNQEQIFNGKMFPRLANLTLNSGTRGQGLDTFKQLNVLILEKCTRIRPQHIEEMLLQVPLKKLSIICTLDFHNGNCENITLQNCYKAISQCQSLEELSLDYHYFMMFQEELPKLKNLRKFSFLPPSYCHCACRERPMSTEVVTHIARVTRKLSIKLGELTENWRQLETFMENLKNVHTLKIIHTKCKTAHIEFLAQTMSDSLREFYFHGVLEWTGTYEFAFFDYDGLLHVLKACRNIEVFDFSDTYCDAEFLENAVDTVRSKRGGRKVKKAPLVFRFGHARMNDQIIKKLKLPDFLSFSNERVDYSKDTVGFKCEW